MEESDQLLTEKINEILSGDRTYSREAYLLITGCVLRGRHARAREILEILRTRVREEYGGFASMVLEGWGLRHARDVGEVVYRLIDAGILCAAEDDRQEEFDIDFELAPSFREDRPQHQSEISRID